ncbi:hypothetical protein CCL15_13635 [Pseudomonas syringae]|uniref:STAND family AAA ATPase n=1 Tax=Pseudomonas syringae TaxID=317 RepID=UPI000BB627BB|nr:hypothetical protein [Pseudomonas syringae]PBP70582.1 hypothetical protein CCL15_13635 [Pseudomonas syringae]
MIIPTPAFEDYLEENEITLQHRQKEFITLGDIYVAPDLKILDDEVDKFSRIISSIKVTTPSSCPSKVAIIGEEQSGKTSLAKELLKKQIENGFFPVLIKGVDVGVTNAAQLVEEAKLKQYAPTSLTPTMVVIEGVENSRLNSKHLSILLKNLMGLEQNVVFLSGKELRFNEAAWKELNEAKRYELLPFGHLLRGELINKWNSLGREATIEAAELHAANDKVTHHIDSLLRKNIFPPKPIFILMILQTLESSAPSDFSLTAYGHCYNALIQQSLRKSKVRDELIDRYVNYLTELAWFIFKSDKSILTDERAPEFKTSYSSRYLIDSHEKVMHDLCNTGLLKSSYEGLGFSYKYIFYFYAAKYIAENHRSEDGVIGELCKKMHSEKHANILIFITYHTKDQEVLDEILTFASSIFLEETPATLDYKDTEHFEELLGAIPELVMESRTTQDIDDHRKSALSRRDDMERNQRHDTDDEPDDDIIETHTFADINRSAKAIEIIGQILRNRHGSLKIEQLNALANTAFMTGLRFLSFYFKITKSLKNDILEELAKVLEKSGSLTDGEIRDEARKLFMGICYSVSFSVIRKISFSTGNDQLAPIFKQIAEEVDTPAVHLISLCIDLEFTKRINRDVILDAMKKIETSTVAYRLLQETIIQHLYLHSIEYVDRQWLSAKLNIPIKEQRLVQNQKKTKILKN